MRAGGALFGLNKGRHADIQIPHTHTSQQEVKDKNSGGMMHYLTGKLSVILRLNKLEAACGIRKILKKGVTIVRAGTSKESTNHRNWR